MHRIFSVSVAAASLGILSAEELRLAAGLATGDTSRDAELSAIGLQVAERMARHCGVHTDGTTTPTLLSETCIETLREPYQDSELLLSRRFVSVISVVEDGETLSSSDYATNKSSGGVMRLINDQPALWSASKIVFTYTAGFASPTPVLKEAAKRLVRLALSQDTRDPMLKVIDIPGVARREFWVGPTDGGDIPSDVADLLNPFCNMVFP